MADTTPAPIGADAALAQLVAAVEAETDPGWDCNSYHPSLWPALKAARAALASAAPQPAVQQGEPVVWRSWDSENSRWNFTLWPDEWAGHADAWEPLYTQPAAPAAQGDALDAARYRCWRDAMIEDVGLQFTKAVSRALPDAVGVDRRPTAHEWDAAIDAARKEKS